MEYRYSDGLTMFSAAVQRARNAVAIRYFDGALTYGELDTLSDAFASNLRHNDLMTGDRVALLMQNIPQLVICLLGTWKAGGIVVPMNPMNKLRELSLLIEDCRPRVLVCEDNCYTGLIDQLEGDIRPQLVLTTSPYTYQSRDDDRALPRRMFVDAPKLESVLEVIHIPGTLPRFATHDLAFLVYTSGTTGAPKAAMIRHEAIAINAQRWAEWAQLAQGDAILGIAPLFHITGLVGNLGLAFYLAAPLIQTYRFEPAVILDAIEECRPAYLVGAITAFIALMHSPGVTPETFRDFKCLTSGGAPIPPATVKEFHKRFGKRIHSGYGLTESSGQSHMTPFGVDTPVSTQYGALAVGVTVTGTDAWIAGEDGHSLPSNTVGEIVLSGPTICAGYWGKPSETAFAFRSDGFRTGDIGYVDDDGWFYVVDRKKDLINSSGYKIWPREVEDVLYTHPFIKEAAVIGIPDAYRGETVKAIVSLKPGTSTTPAEIIAFCKANMAAYKYPRQVEIRDDLPKTLSGKILRRALRTSDG